jgi:hypothetical protein
LASLGAVSSGGHPRRRAWCSGCTSAPDHLSSSARNDLSTPAGDRLPAHPSQRGAGLAHTSRDARGQRSRGGFGSNRRVDTRAPTPEGCNTKSQRANDGANAKVHPIRRGASLLKLSRFSTRGR